MLMNLLGVHNYEIRDRRDGLRLRAKIILTKNAGSVLRNHTGKLTTAYNFSCNGSILMLSLPA